MKKFLLTIALLCGLNHMAMGQTTYSRYDVNHDGCVSIEDATWLVHSLLDGADNKSLQLIDPANADVNQDGRVDLEDIKWVADRLLGRPNHTEPIDPILTSCWSQYAPYNKACPKQCPPGCGSVATAQILRHYRMHDHGFGSVDYVVTRGPVDRVTRDFSVSQAFDWSNMLDEYVSGNYTSVQEDAVSDFIYQVGNALHQQYRFSGTPLTNYATALHGMHHNLHISPKAVYRYRRYYSSSEWLEMINTELEAGRPVYHAGKWVNNNPYGSDADHIYVIDGRDAKGWYHINYGHGSKTQNKFCDLSVINQSGTYPGGSGVCYNVDQHMITDCYPVESGEWNEDNFIVESPLYVTDANPSLSYELGKGFNLAMDLRNYSLDNRNYDVTIGIYNSKDELQQTLDEYSTSMTPVYHGTRTFRFVIPSSVASGEYKLRILCRSQNTEGWIPVLESVKATIGLIVDDDKYELTLPFYHNRETNLRLRENVRVVDYSNQYVEFLLPVVNDSESNFEDNIRMTFLVNGETTTYTRRISVYDHCNVDYHIQIPTSCIELQQDNFELLSVEYYETCLGQWRILEVGK